MKASVLRSMEVFGTASGMSKLLFSVDLVDDYCFHGKLQ
jgi:hypothetical protein